MRPSYLAFNYARGSEIQGLFNWNPYFKLSCRKNKGTHVTSGLCPELQRYLLPNTELVLAPVNILRKKIPVQCEVHFSCPGIIISSIVCVCLGIA